MVKASKDSDSDSDSVTLVQKFGGGASASSVFDAKENSVGLYMANSRATGHC